MTGGENIRNSQENLQNGRVLTTESLKTTEFKNYKLSAGQVLILIFSCLNVTS